MTPAGNGLGALQSVVAVSACATHHPERKNAPSGPCGGLRAYPLDAGGMCESYKSRLRALKSRYLGTARCAALAAGAAAPNSLIQEPKVGKPNNHAGSQGGRP